MVMIDDKKIKEAAKSLRKDFNDDITQGFLVEFGFEKGAKLAINEFLKGLWHPASKEPKAKPKQGKQYVECLGKFRNDRTELCYFDDLNREWLGSYMSDKAVRENLTEWCYVDDLLPKEGGEHD